MNSTPHVRVRPFAYVDDVPAPADVELAQSLAQAYDLAVLGERDSHHGFALDLLGHPNAAREESGFLDVDGEPVGFVWLERDATGREAYLMLRVPPTELSSAALDVAVRHGIDAARRISEPGWSVRTGIWIQDQEGIDAVVAHGLEPVRQFFRMRIDATSTAIPNNAPALPPGVRIAVPRDDAGFRATCLVDNESFLDHWNFTPRHFDEWWELMTSEAGYDPEGWWLLTVDGEPAAICVNDESRVEVDDGYVGVLGVRREFRGRGLATLLLQHAFVRDRDRCRRGTQLSVDSENSTGALRLYEHVGMAPTRVMQGFALPV